MTDQELASLYAKVLLVVAPLRFGAGVKGKMIEAFWHRVPLVGTSIAYEGLGLDLTSFPVADSADAYISQITRLAQSENAWSSVVQMAEAVIFEQFMRNRTVAIAQKVFS